MRTVAFVPAKGESNRISNKNTVILDGEHLFKRKLRQLLACPEIDAVYLDTESDRIIELASDLPVKVLKRDAKLASNKTDGHELFANEAARVEADIYIQCLCTSPFITPEGHLYAASSGKSYVVKAGPKVEVLATNDLGDPSNASPAVAGGRIYLKGRRYLWCIGAP